ncbi:MAG: hypothetical protein CM15mP83_4250 [Flavobacteriaceae bacterium]|nr:MAG: hypothetical protein CM15mP83_4250 [Flavobacteriaceae bacterium]
MISIYNEKIFLFSLVFLVFWMQILFLHWSLYPENAETVQVNLFVNDAANSIGSTFEPGLIEILQMPCKSVDQSNNLELIGANGDLIYEGEITEYRVTPTTATAEQTAAQNRLTVTINVRYINTNNEEDNFEKRFSHFYDFPDTANFKV